MVFSSHTKMLLQHCSTWKRFALASCQRTAHHFVKVEHLEYLLKARENLLYTELRKKMASAMVYTKVGKKTRPDPQAAAAARRRHHQQQGQPEAKLKRPITRY